MLCLKESQQGLVIEILYCLIFNFMHVHYVLYISIDEATIIKTLLVHPTAQDAGFDDNY